MRAIPIEKILINDSRDVQQGVPHAEEDALVRHFASPIDGSRSRERARERGKENESEREKTGEMEGYLRKKFEGVGVFWEEEVTFYNLLCCGVGEWRLFHFYKILLSK